MENIKHSASLPDLMILMEDQDQDSIVEQGSRSTTLSQTTSIDNFNNVLVESEPGQMSDRPVSRHEITNDKKTLDEAKEFLATNTTKRQALKIDAKRSSVKTFFFALGWFFTAGQLGKTSAAEKNAAKKLLANPTYDITRGVRVFGEVNNLLAKFDLEPITFNSYADFLNAYEAGKYNELELTFHQGIQILTLQFGQRDERGEAITITVRELIEPAATAIKGWNDSVISLQSSRTDDQFQGLVAHSRNNVLAEERIKRHDTGKAFMTENAAVLWAQNNVAQFSKELADKFIGQVNGLALNTDKITDLLGEIDDRAGRMHQILDKEKIDFKKMIIMNLNENPAFVEALQKKQAQLKKVVADNQNLNLLSADQITAFKARIADVETAQKQLGKSILKGEIAVVGAFNALLHPESTKAALELVGEEGSMATIQTIADKAHENFNAIQIGLTTLLTGNTDKIAEGQEKAENALGDLATLNHFVHSDELLVHREDVSRPIQELSKVAVAKALREELLAIIERLAGTPETGGSPFMLYTFLVNLDDYGMKAVLGQSFTLNDLFVTAKNDAREEIVNGTYRMIQFNTTHLLGKEELVDDITALRGQIKKIRDDQAMEVNRQLEQKRQLLLAQKDQNIEKRTLNSHGSMFSNARPMNGGTVETSNNVYFLTTSSTSLDDQELPVYNSITDRSVTERTDRRGTLAQFAHRLLQFIGLRSKDKPVVLNEDDLDADFEQPYAFKDKNFANSNFNPFTSSENSDEESSEEWYS